MSQSLENLNQKIETLHTALEALTSLLSVKNAQIESLSTALLSSVDINNAMNAKVIDLNKAMNTQMQINQDLAERIAICEKDLGDRRRQDQEVDKMMNVLQNRRRQDLKRKTDFNPMDISQLDHIDLTDEDLL